MPRHCVVPFCSEKGGFKFPQDEVLLDQWLIAIRKKKFKPTKMTRVCRKHFKPEDFIVRKDPNSTALHIPKLKTGTVPSQFTWTKDVEQEKKEIENAEKFLQIQNKLETGTLCSVTEEKKREERNMKRKQMFLKKMELNKLENKEDVSKMNFSLENDDDMIVLVIGDDDKKNTAKKRKKEKPMEKMPLPVTVKVEPLEEDEDVSLNVENIMKTVAEHGQIIEIKVEPEDYFDYEQLYDELEQPDDAFEQSDDEFKQSDDEFEQPDNYEQLDEDYNPSGKSKSTKNKKSEEKVTKKKNSPSTNKRQFGSKKPPVSFVEEVRNSFPELRKDEKGLITYLANSMRLTVPPDPPRDYYFIDVEGNFICSFCEYKTERIIAAARHYQNSHGTRYLTCYACGAAFWSKTNLYKHEKRCTAPDARVALRARGEYLGRKGRGRPYLSNNKFRPRMNPLDPATGEEKPKRKEKFQCSFCTQQFVHIESWESHENIHKGLRPYKCKICPSAYPSKVGLRKHTMTHGNQKFICDHCNKSFKIKVNLIAHMNTHLPQRKYGCNMCSKRYSQKTALKVHVNRDHLNLPPACACPQCPKRYPRMSHLKDHMLREHGLKLLTRKMFYKNLPRMDLKELKAAQVVFNQPQPVFSDMATEADAEPTDAEPTDAEHTDHYYLEVSDDEVPHTEEQVVQTTVNLANNEQPTVKFAYKEQPTVKFAYKEQPTVKFAYKEQPTVKFANKEQPTVKFANKEQPTVKFANKEQPTVKFANKEQHTVKFAYKEQPTVKFAYKEQPTVKFANKEQPTVKFANKEQPNVKFANKEQPTVKFANKEQPTVKFANKEQPTVKFANKERPTVKFAYKEQPTVKFAYKEQPTVKFANKEQPTVKFANKEQPTVKLASKKTPVFHIRLSTS